MSALTLYFLVMLDHIQVFFIVMCVLGWIYIVVSAVLIPVTIDCEASEEITNFFKKSVKLGIPFIIVWTFITTMIPSTKQVAFIYIVSSLSQNKIVQDIGQKSLQIPDQALDILNTKMNEYLDDMKKEAEEKTKETVKGK